MDGSIMDTEEFLTLARARYEKLYDLEFANKKAYVDNLKFAYNIDNGQWHSEDKEERSDANRPFLTVNKLVKFVRQVANKEKLERRQENIIPVDDRGDKEVARVMDDLIEEIEYRSEADVIYTQAGENAIAGNSGYWRLITEYADDGFDQEIRMVLIENPLMVSLDPRGNFCFIREALSKEEFEAEYPKAEYIDFTGYEGMELWHEEDKIFVSEYFVKERIEKEIAEIIDPLTGESAVIEIDDSFDKSAQVVRKKTKTSHKIMWYKITGAEILDEKEWAGDEIPVYEVVGHQVNVEGIAYKKSLIDDAKDASRLYNLSLTSLAERASLSPKAPFLVTPREILGYEAYWDNANNGNYPYLLFNPTAGRTPQRTPVANVDPGVMTMLTIADNDIKDVLGMYEASMGDISNERSGKAILARSARSDLGNLSFLENLRQARIRCKKELIKLIPKIYDNARIVRLRGKDSAIKINYPMLDENGKIQIINDLSKGKYDIRVNNSQSPTRRQQTVETILQAMQYADKQYSDILLKLLMQYSDAAGAEEILTAIDQRAREIQSAMAEKTGFNPEGA